MEEKIEVDNLIFEFVYELALRDAVMRTAYLGDKSELRKCKEAKNIVRQYADDIIDGKFFDYDGYYKIAADLCNSFNPYIKVPEGSKNKNPQFTFGNAQKLLNMTMKYLYITCYKNHMLRKNFKNCHCPMDGIMIDKVKKKFKNCSRREKEEHIGKFKNISWSRLSFCDEDKIIYQQFQDTVSSLAKTENMFPMEYDYCQWNS